MLLITYIKIFNLGIILIAVDFFALCSINRYYKYFPCVHIEINYLIKAIDYIYHKIQVFL